MSDGNGPTGRRTAPIGPLLLAGASPHITVLIGSPVMQGLIAGILQSLTMLLSNGAA